MTSHRICRCPSCRPLSSVVLMAELVEAEQEVQLLRGRLEEVAAELRSCRQRCLAAEAALSGERAMGVWARVWRWWRG